MSKEKTTLEIIAPSVEEAIENGLDQLGLPRDAVQVEVLDTGSRGLLGIGSRHARIRLSIKDESTPESLPEKPKAPIKKSSEKSKLKESKTEEKTLQDSILGDDHELQVAKAVVEELIDKLHVFAKVTTRYMEPAEKGEERIIFIEVNGDDLSILIGRRSEILNSLQYISSLIVCRELGKWAPLMIDIQGYRSRRERQLRQLAQRLADQAIATGKRQILEPMPANERRVIHLELRDNSQVITESIGEEPNRKVTINLKQ
jgi:spoIIIJ-associated protein